MKDRFKFRVWITTPITRDVEEEKEVSFFIYDIALYDDGGVGFSCNSLLDALDKLNLTEGQCNEIEDYISDNSYSEDWEWYAISFDVIEQCTGLKDKNGKLIYEGDIIREISKKEPEFEEYITEVKWGYCGFNLYDKDEFNFEVIGNIHENKEQ